MTAWTLSPPPREIEFLQSLVTRHCLTFVTYLSGQKKRPCKWIDWLTFATCFSCDTCCSINYITQIPWILENFIGLPAVGHFYFILQLILFEQCLRPSHILFHQPLDVYPPWNVEEVLEVDGAYTACSEKGKASGPGGTLLASLIFVGDHDAEVRRKLNPGKIIERCWKTGLYSRVSCNPMNPETL